MSESRQERQDLPQRLRRAAKILRERAAAATPGPWSHANEHGLLGPDAQPAWYVSQMRPGYESMLPEEGYLGDVAATFSDDREADPNAAYIALMDPLLGAALADWLEETRCALHCDDRGTRLPYCRDCEDSTWDHECPPRQRCGHTASFLRALAIADIVLRSTP